MLTLLSCFSGVERIVFKGPAIKEVESNLDVERHLDDHLEPFWRDGLFIEFEGLRVLASGGPMCEIVSLQTTPNDYGEYTYSGLLVTRDLPEGVGL